MRPEGEECGVGNPSEVGEGGGRNQNFGWRERDIKWRWAERKRNQPASLCTGQWRIGISGYTQGQGAARERKGRVKNDVKDKPC